MEGTFIPYFLTAHHCVSNAPEARSVEAWWFFRRETCGRVEIDDRFAVTHGGAHLLATSADQDSSLLRLRSRPPSGVSYSGWSADPIRHPTSVYGLHHPDGGVMKYAGGATVSQRNVPVGGLGVLVNAIVVRWRSGATERGSSGSGLFDDQALIGVLSGGEDVCVRGVDVYGPFRDLFPRVKRWLDPVFSHAIPFVTPASNLNQQGFVRVVNHSHRAGMVTIHAIDDAGTHFGPLSLSLAAGEAVHFNSGDLEEGNASKGLFRGVGDGNGNWRLELTTALEIEARAYIRTVDGFLTSIHEVAAELGSDVGAEDGEVGGEIQEDSAFRYHVPIFNPGGNESQVSWLRLINPGDEVAEAAIEARDDDGDPAPWGDVRLTLDAGRRPQPELAATRTGGCRLPWPIRKRNGQVATVGLRRPADTGHEPDAEPDRASHQPLALSRPAPERWMPEPYRPRLGFVIAGAQKCGTTALAHFLSQHPEIGMAMPKEVHVFDAPGYSRDWTPEQIDERYRSFFEHCPGARIRGEATPIYLFLPEIAHELARYNPELKLIVLLRDPVERAMSHYCMEKDRGQEHLPLWRALLCEPFRLRRCRDARAFRSAVRKYSYRSRGLYSLQLRNLHRFFDRDRVLILRTENLLRHHDDVLRVVFAFLGVSEQGADSAEDREAGRTQRQSALDCVLAAPPLLPAGACPHACTVALIAYRGRAFG